MMCRSQGCDFGRSEFSWEETTRARLGGGKELGELEMQRCWSGGREGEEVRKVMAQHARPGR